MKLIQFAVPMFICVLTVGAYADFTETFDASGGDMNNIQPTWDVVDPDATTDPTFALVDQGGGDYALWISGYLGGAAGLWGHHVGVAQGFQRANNLRVTWKQWRDRNFNVSGSFPDGHPSSGSMGGFRSAPASTVGALYNNAQYFLAIHWNTLSFCMEGQWSGDLYNPANPNAITELNNSAHWAAALDKANCYLFRITMGNTSGGKFEMSEDQGATWIEPTNANKINQGGGTASTLWLSFGPSHAMGGACFIDDVFVEGLNAVDDWNLY